MHVLDLRVPLVKEPEQRFRPIIKVPFVGLARDLEAFIKAYAQATTKN